MGGLTREERWVLTDVESKKNEMIQNLAEHSSRHRFNLVFLCSSSGAICLTTAGSERRTSWTVFMHFWSLLA